MSPALSELIVPGRFLIPTPQLFRATAMGGCVGEQQEGHSPASSGTVSTWLPRLRPPAEGTLPWRWTTWVKKVAPADGEMKRGCGWGGSDCLEDRRTQYGLGTATVWGFSRDPATQEWVFNEMPYVSFLLDHDCHRLWHLPSSRGQLACPSP